MNKIAVIGGGPAGIFAALAAAEGKARITVFDGNSILGVKLAITGGGRANITNTRDADDFIRAFHEKKNFIKKSFFAFDNNKLISYLRTAGIATISDTEGRMMPDSLSSVDLRDRLVSMLKKKGIDIKTCTAVKGICKDEEGFKISTDIETLQYNRVILATGGRSWPSTGSSGYGYRLAQELGHSVKDPVPALTGLNSGEIGYAGLSGISLERCRLRFNVKGKDKFVEGGLLFTHTGISGPAVLDISRFVARDLVLKKETAVFVDLLPGMKEKDLEKYFFMTRKKNLKQAVSGILPGKIAAYILERSKTNDNLRVADAGKKRITALYNRIKSFKVNVDSTGGWEKAMVSSGGVETGEINPVTMESRIISGLYFAGEIIDIDGPTGGYNIQAACSTGFAAGKAAAVKKPLR